MPACVPWEVARRTQCSHQLRQITLALLNYEQAYKCFPPAYVADKNGKPMHSWRVLILPYIEEESLYKQYDFNEPWDGSNNKKLLVVRPRLFACPSDEQAYSRDATCTSYVAVVGSNAAWLGEQPRRLRDAGFSSTSTIMLVEVADADIDWTEPKDFNLDTLAVATSASSGVKVSSKHMRSNGYFYHDTPYVDNTAFADGRTECLLSGKLTTSNLKRLLTVGGFEEENIDDSWDYEELRINWPNCIVLAVWLISVSLLLHQAFRSRKARQIGIGAAENTA